jgi:superfamily II DNA or RNA helicase
VIENLANRPPEQGQIVRLRHKAWVVTSVARSGHNSREDEIHRVGLECLSDDALGREIQVIWEREVGPRALESTSLPLPVASDSPEMFAAFLRALRWSSSSLAVGDVLQAPFRGGVQIEEYQLAPVLRASRMPRVRLLIADDVGLGKTIEAGLIAQELIHSHRASRILVLCPAHLKQKWVDEMAEKFGLEFRIIERDSVVQMRKEFGPTINPWASFPRLVTSIDYLKTEHPRRLFDEFGMRRREERSTAKPWDLLVLDEAHNVAPAGRNKYVRDSERTSLLRTITEQFEHKIFLTATPHNGYRESFTGLLELLDNLRFSRGTDLDKSQLNAVTVRRLKEEIKNSDGSLRFPPRIILPRDITQDPDLYVDLVDEEREVFDLLQRYTESRLAHTDKRTERPTQFVLTLLKKRALSSPMALRESLVRHTETVGVREELEIGDSLFRSLETREGEDWGDDEEKEDFTQATTEAASRLCNELLDDEKQWLQRMFEIVDELAGIHTVKPDTKARALLHWIETTLRADGEWNGERVIIFTEYKHTLEYLTRVLDDAGYSDVVARIAGGMPDKDRQSVNEKFQAAPELSPIRILLATDAASEGADFQKHCRNLIHYEIPWNPVRLEQRNGRVDRHGQRASEVRIHHFVFQNQEDSEFLKRIVDKVNTIREDLGSVGALIADDVRRFSLRRDVTVDEINMSAKQRIARQELSLEAQSDDDISQMVEVLHKTRESLGITDEAQLDLLEQALALEGLPDALKRRDDGRFVIFDVPGTWSECRRYLSPDDFERPLTFNRIDARDNDHLMVVHLDHPLMRRAAATFRVQMWRDGGSEDNCLSRVSIRWSSKVLQPAIRAWGRLALLGSEHNRLHEGLVSCDVTLFTSGPEANAFPEEIDAPCYDGNFNNVCTIVRPHLSLINKMLVEAGDEKANELQVVLRTRGDTAEKHARSLATERMSAIRKTIREWEKKLTGSPQLSFDLDDEERQQRAQDLQALKDRLDELAAEREVEPKRQRDFYKVVDRRVYPVAIEILMPVER